MKVHKGTTYHVEMNQGIRQGCVLSPLLPKLYSDATFMKPLPYVEVRTGVHGEPIRYVVTVIPAENVESLRAFLNKPNTVGEETSIQCTVCLAYTLAKQNQ